MWRYYRWILALIVAWAIPIYFVGSYIAHENIGKMVVICAAIALAIWLVVGLFFPKWFVPLPHRNELGRAVGRKLCFPLFGLAIYLGLTEHNWPLAYYMTAYLFFFVAYDLMENLKLFDNRQEITADNHQGGDVSAELS